MGTQIETITFNDSLMKTILENMEENITVFDVKGNLFYLNQSAQKSMDSGYSLVSEANVYRSEGLYHSDGKTPIKRNENPIFRVLNNETIMNEEIWLITKGKPLCILMINGKPIYNENKEIIGALMVSYDITKRRWEQQRLKVSEERCRSLIDHHPDIVCWLDLKGVLLDINAAIEKIAGYDSKVLLNQPVKPLVIKQDWLKIKRHFLKATKGIPQNFETSTIHLNGNILFLHITLVPITIENKIVSIYAIAKDITAQKEDEQRIHYLAYHDTLTGLPNRIMFQNILNNHLQTAKKNAAILFIDLDRFKIINDTLGHSVGDILLKEVANRLSNCINKEQTLFRFGGDEFTMILPEVTQEKTEMIAKQIIDKFLQPFELDEQEYVITPSIGISVYPLNGDNIEDLIRKADTAMYRAKEKGKNIFQFYTDDMNESIIKKMKIEKSLYRALEHEQFVIHYQPQFSIEGKMIGMEALIRWYHPELGLVSPADFIPIAEETGLIVHIGKWVLLNACRQNKLWQMAGLPPIRVAVNLSARQFQDEKLVNVVKDILSETELDPMYLELEITESMAMQDGDAVVAKLKALKRLGLNISIDDFGTGYCSLSYLKKFPVDRLKIDRSFIQSITKGSDELTIVKAIIVMAKSMNLKVIAEGVELDEQEKLLTNLGCNELQGYLYGKPVPFDQLIDKFRRLEQF